MIRHMVHLRFREDVGDGDKIAIFGRLAALQQHIEGVLDFQYRANVSPEAPVVRGFFDMFWFDFRDSEARDAYLADPEHQAVGADLLAASEGGADGVFVCDIEL